MTQHVISTLARDTRYAQWVTNAGLNTIQKTVLVRGGAGVAPRLVGVQGVETPRGVRTEVSDADAEFLRQHPQFKDHEKRGYVRIVKIAADPNNAAKSMNKDDGSRQRTPEDVDKAKPPGQDVQKMTATTNKK